MAENAPLRSEKRKASAVVVYTRPEDIFRVITAVLRAYFESRQAKK
jgi:hypothetical protein